MIPHKVSIIKDKTKNHIYSIWLHISPSTKLKYKILGTYEKEIISIFKKQTKLLRIKEHNRNIKTYGYIYVPGTGPTSLSVFIGESRKYHDPNTVWANTPF